MLNLFVSIIVSAASFELMSIRVAINPRTDAMTKRATRDSRWSREFQLSLSLFVWWTENEKLTWIGNFAVSFSVLDWIYGNDQRLG
jgi:hypothetical protein